MLKGLLYSILHGDEARVSELLTEGVDLNTTLAKSTYALPLSPLHACIAAGHVSILRKLLQAGASPNLRVDDRRALHFAVCRGNAEVVAALIEAGADVQLVDAQGRTALWNAVDAGRLDLVLLLLERKCLINWGDVKDRTVLDYAYQAWRLAKKDRELKGIIRTLVLKGAISGAHRFSFEEGDES
jgi:Ankyrin repeats (3 copies)